MPQIDLGGNDYDSFTDVASADIILAGDVLRAAPWATRNPDAKKRGLISATRMLLPLPWIEVPPFEDAPPAVQEATATLASDLLSKPKLFADATGNSNVKSVKAGSASVEFFSPVVGGPAVPMAIWSMLVNAGLVTVPVVASENAGAEVSGIMGDCRPVGGRSQWEYPVAAEDHD